MIEAVLILYLALGGSIEITKDPAAPVATVEECKEQLDELFASASGQLPLIASQVGPVERIVGECRRMARPGQPA